MNFANDFLLAGLRSGTFSHFELPAQIVARRGAGEYSTRRRRIH
jgi:hypothetical protein